MSSSFGNNKRKPGATAGAVTEAKRRATLAQNWDDYSKQPKVPGASIVPSFFGRNAGIQSIFYAQNNGANPYVVPPIVYYPGLTFAGFKWTYEGNNTAGYSASYPTITDVTTWGQRYDSIVSSLINPSIFNNTSNNGVFSNGSTSGVVAVYFKGYYKAPISGSYVFTFSADDGKQLRLNNQLIINEPGSYGGGPVASTPITLTEGIYYPFEILLSNVGGQYYLRMNSISVGSTPIFTQNSNPTYSTTPTLDTYNFFSCLFNTGPITLPGNTITGALSFVNGYIRTPYPVNPLFPSSSLDLSGVTTEFTIEWFQKMTSFSGSSYPRPFCIGTADQGPLSVSLEYGGQLRLWKGANTYAQYNMTPAQVQQLNNWTHFAVVKYTNGTANVFLNGIRVINQYAFANANAGTASNFVIGNWDNGQTTTASPTQFKGYITNFRVIITPNAVGGAIYPNNPTLTVPSAPLPYVSNTKLLMNVISDPLKYRYIDASSANSNPSFTTAGTVPTFAAAPDPLA